MTPQGQVLTLKSPLVPGQVAAVPSTLLQAELKPRAVSNTMTAQPGMVMLEHVNGDTVHSEMCVSAYMVTFNFSFNFSFFTT